MATTMAARIRGYDNNHGTGAMPVIPNDATSNVEYVSGGAYYIHTKATPHLYWSIRNGNNGFITLDTRRQPNSESIAMTRESLHQHRKMIALSLKDGIQLLALSSSGSHNIGVMGQSVSVNATSFRFSLGSFTMETSGMPGMRNSNTPQCQPSLTNSSTLVRSGSLCTRVATKESLRSLPLIQRLGVCE
jgi:hypothetical protein